MNADLTLPSIVLMVISVGAAAFLPAGYLSAVPGTAAIAAMIDRASPSPHIPSVSWFCIILALVLASAAVSRAHRGRRLRRPDPAASAHSAHDAISGCGTLLMAALLLHVDPSDGSLGHASHLFLDSRTLMVLAVGYGIACAIGLYGASRRGRAAVVEMAGMGSSVIVMAAAMT